MAWELSNLLISAWKNSTASKIETIEESWKCYDENAGSFQKLGLKCWMKRQVSTLLSIEFQAKRTTEKADVRKRCNKKSIKAIRSYW